MVRRFSRLPAATKPKCEVIRAIRALGKIVLVDGSESNLARSSEFLILPHEFVNLELVFENVKVNNQHLPKS
jgi:hypothetical protein